MLKIERNKGNGIIEWEDRLVSRNCRNSVRKDKSQNEWRLVKDTKRNYTNRGSKTRELSGYVKNKRKDSIVLLGAESDDMAMGDGEKAELFNFYFMSVLSNWTEARNTDGEWNYHLGQIKRGQEKTSLI